MNYRHAFHAGNFADVIKHIVLVRILTYLQEKPAAFRVIDTHAGAGVYDLTGEQAEPRRRMADRHRTADAGAVFGRRRSVGCALSRYRQGFQSAARPAVLSGVALIARALLRPQDRMVACELEPVARKHLIGALRRDTQANVVDLDGWVALPAFVPPKERRGLVLIDPPFERKDEFERLAGGFAEAFAKWPTGSYMLWYPAKSRRTTDDLARRVGAVAGGGRRQMPATGIQRGAADRGRAAHFGRASDRQSTMDVEGRTQGHPSRTGETIGPGRRRPVQAGGDHGLSRPCLGGLPSKKSGRERPEVGVMIIVLVIAFSSEVEFGSREENASNQKDL